MRSVAATLTFSESDRQPIDNPELRVNGGRNCFENLHFERFLKTQNSKLDSCFNLIQEETFSGIHYCDSPEKILINQDALFGLSVKKYNMMIPISTIV